MTGTSERSPDAEDIDVGDAGPELVVEDIDREDFVRYAGASGDFNPLHYDEQFARDAGNEGVFAHGMLTAGYVARLVTAWFGLAQIQTFNVRFRDRVWPGDTLTITTEVTEKKQDEDATIVDVDILVQNQADETVLTGVVSAGLQENRDSSTQA